MSEDNLAALKLKTLLCPLLLIIDPLESFAQHHWMQELTDTPYICP